MDTVLSRVEKGNNKQLHDIVQKYSSGEISREPVFLGLNAKNGITYIFALKIENRAVLL